MRICIVVDNLNESTGWGRLARKLEENLVKKGHQVGFVTNGSGGLFDNVLEVPLRSWSIGRSTDLFRGVMDLRKHASRYDTVFCFDVNPYGIVTAAALLGLRTRFVIYCLGSYSLLTRNTVRNILMRFAFLRADRVLVVGEFLRAQIRQSGLDLKNAGVLPVGVDPEFFYPVRTQSLLAKPPYIIGVGAIKHRKGFHLSIEAFAMIAGDFPDLHYVIIGHSDGGEYSRGLIKRVSELGLRDRVVFLDGVPDEDLRALYSFSELFILTPITERDALEGFGMVYLEAAMCGKAAIGTLESGAVEAIVDGETGLLSEPTPEKIAEALSKMLGDASLTRRLAVGAQARSREFVWDVITDKLVGFLKN